MGFFGTRKAVSRDHAAVPCDRLGASPNPGASNRNIPELASLFSEAADEAIQQSPSSRTGRDLPAPIVDMADLDELSTKPQDAVVPFAENQYKDADRSSGTVRKEGSSRTQTATGLQEIAMQRAESLSRLAKRNSIKRSISRKIARSESRRQLLQISDGSLTDDNGALKNHHRTSSSVTSPASSRKEGQNEAFSDEVNALVEPPSPANINVSVTSGVDDSSLAEPLNDLPLSNRSDKFQTAEMHDEMGNNHFGEEEAIILDDDVDDDVDDDLGLSHARISGFDPGPREVAGKAGVVHDTTPKSSKVDGNVKTRKSAKQRKRPPPLLSADNSKMSPNSAVDWPSGGCFGSDGGFMTGGFKITTEGMVGKPSDLKRKDSDSEQDAAAPASSRNIVIVKSLKEFRAGPTIGAGAGGRVYLAQHMPSKQTMAIKVVNVYEKEKRNQLLKELETLSTHVSRYLVRFYGAFYNGTGAVHIALEYMDHGCLSTFVQRVGPIPENIMQMIASDCLRGLKFLHRHHVLHRDFKTANILLSRKLCCAKLSDFGLARDVNPGMSKVETFVGTVAYMSPERLQGSKYTYASDIWGLGVCIVECLLGRYPFDKPKNYFEYIEATMTSNIFKGFNSQSARFSADVRDFVSLCTMTDPRRRPASNQLLKHPWLKDINRDVSLFGAWLDECRVLSMLPGTAAGKRS